MGNTWWLVQLTPEAAEAHDRRVYGVADDVTLGWHPYTYHATRGAVSQWACHNDAQLAGKLRRHGLSVGGWSEWRDGMRTTRLVEA
jgi:hypothetical protein